MLYRNIERTYNGLLAQLDRVLASEARGHRFESCTDRHVHFFLKLFIYHGRNSALLMVSRMVLVVCVLLIVLAFTQVSHRSPTVHLW